MTSSNLRITLWTSKPFWMFGMIVFYPVLYFVPVVSDEPLNWPSCSISESANSVPLNLSGEFLGYENRM